MKNVYQNSDMVYSEVVTALEDYTYGGVCKIYMPSVSALLPKTTKKETKKLGTSNIMNKDKSKLGIDKYTSCSYVELVVPLNLCPKCGGSINDIKHINTCGECTGEVYHVRCSHSGKKGDQFIVTFIEGDTQKCNIIGRYE